MIMDVLVVTDEQCEQIASMTHACCPCLLLPILSPIELDGRHLLPADVVEDSGPGERYEMFADMFAAMERSTIDIPEDAG